MGVGLCENLDMIDLVLWDITGDFGRWTETIGDFGRRLSNSSSRSGVRERPSESLKLFSLGMVVQVVVVMDERDRGKKAEYLVFGLLFVTNYSFRAFIRNLDAVVRSVGHEDHQLVIEVRTFSSEMHYTCTSFKLCLRPNNSGRQRNYDVLGGRGFDHTGFCESGSFSCRWRR